MVLSQVGAAICALLLIFLIAVADIEAGDKLGPAVLYGQNIQHSEGIIKSINPHQDFVLVTAEGQREHFYCRQRCLYQWSHVKRHYYEHAYTDVYYVSEPKGTFVAIGAD